MFQQILLAIIGFSSGVIIAGGVVGLLIGLSIVPRYAGITHTGKHILLYEDITLLGILFGNLFFLLPVAYSRRNGISSLHRPVLRYLSWRMDHGSC